MQTLLRDFVLLNFAVHGVSIFGCGSYTSAASLDFSDAQFKDDSSSRASSLGVAETLSIHHQYVERGETMTPIPESEARTAETLNEDKQQMLAAPINGDDSIRPSSFGVVGTLSSVSNDIFSISSEAYEASAPIDAKPLLDNKDVKVPKTDARVTDGVLIFIGASMFLATLTSFIVRIRRLSCFRRGPLIPCCTYPLTKEMLYDGGDELYTCEDGHDMIGEDAIVI